MKTLFGIGAAECWPLMQEEPPVDGADGGGGDEGGGAGEGGALSGAAGDGAPSEPDWEKMTDEEYFKGFTAPEGVEVDVGEVAKDYGQFLRTNHISQKTFSDFLRIADGVAKREGEAERAAAEKAEKDARATMAAERAALDRAYNPEQLKTAVETLSGFKGDGVFFEEATGRLANNPTLVRLLLNWADTHGSDGLPGQKPAGNGGDDFVNRWTGVR